MLDTTEPDVVLVNPRLWPASGLHRAAALASRLVTVDLGIIVDAATPSELRRTKLLRFAAYIDKRHLSARGLNDILTALFARETKFLTAMSTDRPLVPELSGRELDLLELLASGLESREIARRLRIGERTIKMLIGNVLRRLGAENRAHAVAIACELELISGWEIDA
ncbi:helix-turn-helix transcriptional regulator [Tenggerimyces flavus]|uniref:LuxR C-terminal-related transcriptional regulator n=1 Tax=Tenggerimyces flavus TaxID=1708749 RepID=A0ABV7YN12_9ACTN|nr:LuxR C-terminal-related transcriptional regulator [Tenggerimyces flavus]MBM7789585.1 DNA-binding NarL/FixJ family response regulator [Tenggerimyces flavus]